MDKFENRRMDVLSSLLRNEVRLHELGLMAYGIKPYNKADISYMKDQISDVCHSLKHMMENFYFDSE